tara:strand:- start:909 stop:3005 length:2097 start_codon:yes stop_codon:yes gene_type:complete
MKYIKYLSLLLLVSSCGGGGGGGAPAVPFAITLGLTSFSVNEDGSYTGSISATANEVTTLTYQITSPITSGTFSLNEANGAIIYTPQADFNGTDQFSYSVTASQKSVTNTATVDITVVAVNDSPVFEFETPTSLSKDDMLFDSDQTFRVKVSDVDNTLDELTYDLFVGDQSIPAVFTLDTGENTNGSGSLAVDISQLTTAGLYTASIRAYDGAIRGSSLFETWFVSNKTTVTINQDDDPEDGYNGGAKTPTDYYVYYLSGNPTSMGESKYLFIADSLDGQDDIDLYRRALIASINKLNDSDASEFFSSDYFTVVSAEPVVPDGTSPVGVRTGCYDFDENIYCISSMDTAIFDVLLPDNLLVSTLTRVDGRGVNQGNRNIQRVTANNPERTKHTLMHELGHAHGYMGDEYRSDERDVTDSGYNVNTTTQSDVSLLKWNHHIEDVSSVLGKDIKVCYNMGDGRIYDRDTNEYVAGDDCGCLANNWGALNTTTNDYPFLGKNPECGKVGLYEGNYYGSFDNYRPTYCSVMDSCTSGGYGKVNVEGFAVASIQNQGFNVYDADINFTTDDAGDAYTGIRLTVNAVYDTSKITLKWYADGVEDTSKQDQKTVTFDKPATGAIVYYTAKAVDLTGTISAPDDVLDRTDFYEGAFESYLVGCSGYVSGDGCDYDYEPSSSTYSDYDFLYWNGPLGFTWGQNWTKW